MRRLPWLTAAVALATSVVLAIVPFSRSTSCVSTSDGRSTCSSSTSSLLDTEGASVLVVLAVPVAVALVGALQPRRRGVLIAVAAALTVGVVLAAMSIGVFYVPTLVAAWFATTRSRHAQTGP